MLFKRKETVSRSPSVPEKTREEYSLEYAQRSIREIAAQIDACDRKALTELDVCNKFILPFFRVFGWDPAYSFWHSQYRIGHSYKHVDYAFSKTAYGLAFIEAKKLIFRNIDSNKNFVKQITGYFNADPGAHLIILTNGEEYCFYSYGETSEICLTPFIKFNIHKVDLTGTAKPLERLFYRKFNISDWAKLAGMSRTLAGIRHSLRAAPDCLTKQNIIEKSFALIYPDIPESERKDLLAFFTEFS